MKLRYQTRWRRLLHAKRTTVKIVRPLRSKKFVTA